ncbi:DNA polymerase V [Halomonas korlensis]|uniref:DNA polymerase V n=1 Tax=Halomonas korlensis TaxID=463301 RepID=A0A1I7FJI4_9GAMM|nr:DNA polymerase V [Halomonas korlensis]
MFLRTNPHRPGLLQYSSGAVAELERPTDDSREILHAASRALEGISRPRYRFMKVGVMLLDLIDANRQQLSFLDSAQSEAERERSAKLMAAMDELNQKMGRAPSRLADLGLALPGTCVVRTARRAGPSGGVSCSV